MAKSIMEQIALLPEEERNIVLAGMDPDELIWDWSVWGRPEQQAPAGMDWAVWLYMAGRGAGKTRTAAEWIREKAKDSSHGKLRFLLVARTAADVREVLVEGESGILSVSPPDEMPLYEPSKRRLTWPNGNQAFCTSADEPDSLRGVQAHYSWGDEVAAWRQTPDGAGMTAWDNLRVATRLSTGSDMQPQIIATTTPKRVPILYALLEEQKKNPERVKITRGSTLDNSGNLSGAYLDAITGVYEGTRLAAQELYGEMLDAIDGALWTEELIEDNREWMLPLRAPLRVIGVDPSVAENPRDECGIVVCASTTEHDLYKRQSWVLEDASVHGSPDLWANQVVKMARKWGCPVVAEVNQGGALVANAIHTIDPTIKVLEVHSKVGKQLRAEPITLAYEQGRVHHIDRLVDLEEQMTTWVPGDSKSPDRVDALVHALTALLIKPPAGFTGGKITAKSFGDRRMGLSRAGTRATGSSVFRVR
jgi:phage terminase large subunit-like protein